MDIISRMRREYRDIREIRRGVEILEKEKKKKNRFQVNDKSSPCFEDNERSEYLFGFSEENWRARFIHEDQSRNIRCRGIRGTRSIILSRIIGSLPRAEISRRVDLPCFHEGC